MELNTIVSEAVMPVWFLIGASLVFFMQCGFAMVETGFTRAKNAGNIIMKNLMDFCIRNCSFCFDRCRLAAWRRFGWNNWQAWFRYIFRLC